jgi:ribosomal protein L20A (L18A)
MGSNQSVQRYEMKITSNGRRPPMEDDLQSKMTQNKKSIISQQPLVGSYPYLTLNQMGSSQSVQRYEMKTISDGRRSQNMKSKISQQPLDRSCSNLKLKLMGSNKSVQRYEIKMTSNVRPTPMEDDLKIRKVEYLSNPWSDLTQI